MATSRLLPKFFGSDLPALVDWAERLIVYFEQEVNEELALATPVGLIADWPVPNPTEAPQGWLLCEGQVVAIATYPGLYATLGTTFNTGGEGAGNFRLPAITVTLSGVASCKRIIRHD